MIVEVTGALGHGAVEHLIAQEICEGQRRGDGFTQWIEAHESVYVVVSKLTGEDVSAFRGAVPIAPALDEAVVLCHQGAVTFC